jgi:hypothetical protein
MKLRQSRQALVFQKYRALASALDGRATASSASLARSYGLPLDQVQKILRDKGVQDDG